MKKILATHGTMCPPAMGESARFEFAILLRQLQLGMRLPRFRSRPAPEMGYRARELRVQDQGTTWRVVYRVKPDALILQKIEAVAGGAA